MRISKIAYGYRDKDIDSIVKNIMSRTDDTIPYVDVYENGVSLSRMLPREEAIVLIKTIFSNKVVF